MYEYDIDIQIRLDGFWVILFSPNDDEFVREKGPFRTFQDAEDAGNALADDLEARYATRH